MGAKRKKGLRGWYQSLWNAQRIENNKPIKRKIIKVNMPKKTKKKKKKTKKSY